MDTLQIISTIVFVVFGGGGIVAYYKAWATKQVGLSGVEVEDKAVNTADWTAWQEHWPAQIDRLETRVSKLEQDRADDEDHIRALEAHIWARREPPPPERRRRDPPTEREAP